MQMTPATTAVPGITTPVLQSANQQPTLASALISKTVEGLMRAQVAQTSAQPVNAPESGSIDVSA